MNVQKIFQNASNKLLIDFNTSAEVSHNCLKDDFREGHLRSFLLDGRLPEKYGIESGQIVTSYMQSSKQCDLVIYNKLENVFLIQNEQFKIFPIETVFGVIEVKSHLTKTTLIEALENIKSVKKIALEENINHSTIPGFGSYSKRPKPFGCIFAYAISGNSEKSLLDNLKEWSSNEPSDLWTNIICVLNVGIFLPVYIENRFSYICLTNDYIEKNNVEYGFLNYSNDSLFRFYSSLLTLCSQYSSVPFKMDRYFDKTEKLDNYLVQDHFGFENDDRTKSYKLNFKAIDEIYKSCNNSVKISNLDLFKMFIEENETNLLEILDYCYFYNPQEHKIISELIGKEGVGNLVYDDKGKPSLLLDGIYLDKYCLITINNAKYAVPIYYTKKKNGLIYSAHTKSSTKTILQIVSFCSFSRK